MRFDSAPDRHRWLSNNSMMVAAKLATSPKSNWTSVKIGDVVEKISTGTTPPSQERRYYDGEIDWYTPSDIGGVRWLTSPKKTITSEAVNEKKARMFDAGTILITCIGQIGRVGILPKESSSNQQITGVKFVSGISPEFAYFSLFARQDQLEAAAPTASTLSILNQNRLSEIDFSFPSIKEQKQIAAFLAWCEDRLLSGKPFTNDFPGLPDYLKDLPRIVAHIESLAARVNEAQRLREEAIAETKALYDATLLKVFAELKTHTKSKPIGETNLLINNETRNPQKQTPDEEFLYVDIAAVENGTGKIISPQKLLGNVAPSRARRVIKKNDIILSTVRPNLKAFAIVPPELDNQICSTGFAVFTCPSDILPHFMLYQFFSPYFLGQAVEAVVGGHYPALNDKAINSLEVVIPPLDEQRRIVAYLDGLQAKVNALRGLQVNTQAELQALLPSILDKAFKDEL